MAVLFKYLLKLPAPVFWLVRAEWRVGEWAIQSTPRTHTHPPMSHRDGWMLGVWLLCWPPQSCSCLENIWTLTKFAQSSKIVPTIFTVPARTHAGLWSEGEGRSCSVWKTQIFEGANDVFVIYDVNIYKIEIMISVPSPCRFFTRSREVWIICMNIGT